MTVARLISNYRGGDSIREGLGSIFTSFQRGPSKKIDNYNIEVFKSKNEWKDQLTKNEYKICRKGKLEKPNGIYNNNKLQGYYYCKCCNNILFSSQDKYQHYSNYATFSSFLQNVGIKYDYASTIPRKHIICTKCNAYLGYVFRDGPPPFGKRYCVFSTSLLFIKQE